MSKDKQPEGYCAWHPENGYMPINEEGDVAIITEEERAALTYLHSGNSPAGKRLRREGWQIKSVWLSTEPPVPKEVWGEIERLLDMLCDLKTWPEARWLIEKAWEIREAILPKQPKGEK